MKILSLEVDGGGFDSPLKIADDNVNASNWITVFIGANGTRKSLLLRLLAEAGLSSNKYKGHGHPSIGCSLNLQDEGSPNKVIAISGTPFDRFPRGGTRDWHRKRLNAYEQKGYVYLGQRAANGVVSAMQSEKTLASIFIRYADRLSDRSVPLTRIFNHLNLRPALGIRLKRPSYLNIKTSKPGIPVISESRYASYVKSLPEKLEGITASPTLTKNWVAQIKFFAEQLQTEEVFSSVIQILSDLHESQIAFWLTPEKHKISDKALGWKNFSDWRCAIELGLVEIEGLNLASQDIDSLPTLAKNAMRDNDLSSGQWNWLSSLGGLALELEDHSLVLIDEPENSLHPSWQREYIKVLSEILNCHNHCHAIIATHSPFVASGISENIGNVRSLKMGYLESEKRWHIQDAPMTPSYGWAATDVYEDVFGMDSTRAPEFVDRTDRALRLLSEQKPEDAVELGKLIPQLELDVLRLPAYDIMREVLMDIVTDAKELGQ